MEPRRVQLSRKKGWKMPENTVKVSRPTKWGNPFKVGPDRTAAEAVERFRAMVEGFGDEPNVRMNIESLRGKNLACWCRLCPEHKDGKPLGIQCEACGPCHADVLLELANAPATHKDEAP